MTGIIGTKLPKGIATADMTSYCLLPDGERKGAENKQMYNSVKNEIKPCSVLWGCQSVLAKTSGKMQSWRLAEASGTKISASIAPRSPDWHKVLLRTTLAKHHDFRSQKGISGGLNSPDEVMGEMVSETNLFQTACSCVQKKSNKQKTGEMRKENMFDWSRWHLLIQSKLGKKDLTCWWVWEDHVSSADCPFNLELDPLNDVHM